MQNSATQLIVNADDVGYIRAINRGIFTAIDQGIVTSVSLVANGWDFDHAVDHLLQRPQISVGWHVNLTTGRPLLGAKVPSLINRDGTLLGKSHFIYQVLRNRVSMADINNECLAQFEKIRTTGLAISHVDSHHDIHCLPFVAKIFLAIFKETRLKKLRFVGSRIQILKKRITPTILFDYLCYQFGAALYSHEKEFFSSHYVWGLELHQCKNKVQIIQEYLQHMKPGIHLLVTHPGLYDPSSPYDSAYIRQRESECDALCHPQINELVKQKVSLSSFK